MSNRPGKTGQDPLAREVDRLLRQLNPAIADAPPAVPVRERSGMPIATSPRSRPRPAPPVPADATPSSLGVWARAVLGAILCGAMTQWPYAVCGLPLAGYLVAVAMVVIAGIWAAHAAWRARMGGAHVVAIVLIFAGTALAALQVLPRVGYAPVAISWHCST